MTVPTIGDRDYARRLCVHSFAARPGHPIGREMITNLLENAAGAPAFGLAHRLLANVLEQVITEAERLGMPPHEQVEIFRSRLDSGRAEEIGIVDRALVEELGGKTRAPTAAERGATVLSITPKIATVLLFVLSIVASACTFPSEGTGEQKHERIPLPDFGETSSSSTGAIDPSTTIGGGGGDASTSESEGGETLASDGESSEGESSDGETSSSSTGASEPWGTCSSCDGECIEIAGPNCLDGCELCTHACESDRDCPEGGICDGNQLCALPCGSGCPSGMVCTYAPPAGDVCVWDS